MKLMGHYSLEVEINGSRTTQTSWLGITSGNMEEKECFNNEVDDYLYNGGFACVKNSGCKKIIDMMKKENSDMHNSLESSLDDGFLN